MARLVPRLDVLLVGGGMISRETILPTLFQEQDRGRIGRIAVASRRAGTIAGLRRHFPGRAFAGFPDPDRTDPEAADPTAYRAPLARLPENGAVLVATPDDLHTPVILDAIRAGRHVHVQKPLCLTTAEARRIAREAKRRGIYVYTDYHKRHDPAVRLLRARLRAGDLGEVLHGHAWIEERREMALKHFARWCERSSPFDYIGVHYADAFHFVTGLRPRRVAAFGQKKLLKGLGKDAFDAVQAAIEWENGAVFWIQASWALPQGNPALTNQGMALTGTEGWCLADHKDRNFHLCTTRSGFEQANPDFFRTLDSFEAEGAVEHRGYGADSIVQGLDDIRGILAATRGRHGRARARRANGAISRLAPLRPVPEQALVATAVAEGVRLSLRSSGRFVVFSRNLTPSLGT